MARCPTRWWPTWSATLMIWWSHRCRRRAGRDRGPGPVADRVPGLPGRLVRRRGGVLGRGDRQHAVSVPGRGRGIRHAAAAVRRRLPAGAVRRRRERRPPPGPARGSRARVGGPGRRGSRGAGGEGAAPGTGARDLGQPGRVHVLPGALARGRRCAWSRVARWRGGEPCGRVLPGRPGGCLRARALVLGRADRVGGAGWRPFGATGAAGTTAVRPG